MIQAYMTTHVTDTVQMLLQYMYGHVYANLQLI